MSKHTLTAVGFLHRRPAQHTHCSLIYILDLGQAGRSMEVIMRGEEKYRKEAEEEEEEESNKPQ